MPRWTFATLLLPLLASMAIAEPKPAAVADEDHYRVEVAATQGGATLSIHPKAGYKVNQDYPTRVTVTATEGVTLASQKLSKKDAKTFTEKVATFFVGYQATASGEVTAKVKFSVCNPKRCDLCSEELRWQVAK